MPCGARLISIPYSEKAFPCPHCSKHFGRRDALKRHLEVRGPNHNDFSKKASAGQSRTQRIAQPSTEVSSATMSPTSDLLQAWDDCGSSGVYLGSEEPSAVSSPLIDVPLDFDWPSGLPSAPATHLDYGALIGSTQFWEELLS